MEHKVKIKMAETTRGSVNGTTVTKFLKGMVYEVPESLAKQFRLSGVLVLPETTVDKYIAEDKSLAKSLAAVSEHLKNTSVQAYLDADKTAEKSNAAAQQDESIETADADPVKETAAAKPAKTPRRKPTRRRPASKAK